jgi:acetate kinase
VRPGAPILALNPGSSSLKAAVRTGDDPQPTASMLIERVGTEIDIATAVEQVADAVTQRGLDPEAVAHRVVHGGPHYFDPTVIGDGLLADLRAAVPLAPLHLPGALETIEHARRHWPDVPHVACFDTGFYRQLPEVSRRLPVARQLSELGIRRYGFHGLSVQSVLIARPDIGAAVIAHLGSGCSVTAVGADGLPRHNTMSFTPTAGMMSATRTGDLDPEVALYLIDEHGYTADRLRDLFNRDSGLAGVADGRRDIRDLESAADDHAALALDMFVQSAAMAIAACATTLDRWQTLVFTGGVGEHATSVRERICARLRCDGIEIAVVVADEERVMDRLTRSLVTSLGA